jgi:adenylate cyclase
VPVFHLVPSTEGDNIELAEGPPRVLGRSPATDIPVFDVTISREHAELARLADGVRVRDLGSTNGTFVNGVRVQDHIACEGDTVAFGSVVFRLSRAPGAGPGVSDDTKSDLATAHHQVNVVKTIPAGRPVPPLPVDSKQPAADERGSGLLSLVRGLAEEHVARKLAALLELATELGRHPDVDQLLQRIIDLSFTALRVDRAAALVVEGDALELLPRAGKVRRGKLEEAGRVPRSVAYQVLTERVAVLSENLGEDERFPSESARRLTKHSALCIPLVGEGQHVLGLLYLENFDRQQPFDEEDLELMTAFGGLAAMALDHHRLERRARQETEAVARLQRYLAPGLAAELALRDGGVSLLYPGRRAAVLFQCELHDFAAPADALPPADLAELLGAYLSRLSGVVFEYGGTLANVCGHTVLALWGAPLARPGDADRALRAALAARQVVGELQRQWSRRGVARLELAVGIAAGEVFVGELSGGQRVEYAVVGSLLNAAARICQEAGSGVLVGEAFYRSLTNPPPARSQQVRGVGDARRLTGG